MLLVSQLLLALRVGLNLFPQAVRGEREEDLLLLRRDREHLPHMRTLPGGPGILHRKRRASTRGRLRLL